MQLTIDIGYDQVFQLVRQLSPRERERLAKEIVPAKSEPFLSDDEQRQDLIVLERSDGYSIVQVPFPDTEEGRMREKKLKQEQKEFREKHPELFVERSKEEIEESRKRLLKAMSELPTATPEDIKYMEEMRRMFPWRTK
jgi:uncharacterized membrane protein YheB (UPF0754 family)